MKSRIIDHLIQGVVVFASVFLAFWLTDIRTNKDVRHSVNQALENIASEMMYNHKRIEFTFDYYVDILTQIDSLQTCNPDYLASIPVDALTGWKGVQMPMLRSTAYQSMLNTGIAKNLHFETLNTLAFIYNLQSIIEKGDHSYIEKFIIDLHAFDLLKVQHYFKLYVEVLPDILACYQALGLKHLEKHGYNSKVESKLLSRIVEERKVNFDNIK